MDEVQSNFNSSSSSHTTPYVGKPIICKDYKGTNGGTYYCFECIGNTSVMQEAFESSREGCGRTIILGVTHGKPLSLDCIQLLHGRSVTGCFFGGVKHKSDVPMLAHKYLHEELSLDGFITHQVDFEDINKAFDYLHQGECLRCIIWMDRSAMETLAFD